MLKIELPQRRNKRGRPRGRFLDVVKEDKMEMSDLLLLKGKVERRKDFQKMWLEMHAISAYSFNVII